MPFTIVRQDITKMKVDAVVNAANTNLTMGGGVCGAIFKAAGQAKLQAACQKLSPIKTSEAVITSAFNLPSKYIIHTAGPVYNILDKAKCREQLFNAYTNSLESALEHKCESIAFPLISSGIYGYPKDKALETAVSAIKTFLEHNDMNVYLAVFDKNSFVVSKKIIGDIESYIDENYVQEHFIARPSRFDKLSSAYIDTCEECKASDDLDDIINNLDEPFNITLLRLIDEKGKTDAQVYKQANIDRKLFSKIRTGKNYHPSKRTVLALAISLELTLTETDSLLKKAGYALSHSEKFDVIVEYFIINSKYDVFEINEFLFKYDQPLLGAV